jgi:hypothetical protein
LSIDGIVGCDGIKIVEVPIGSLVIYLSTSIEIENLVDMSPMSSCHLGSRNTVVLRW